MISVIVPIYNVEEYLDKCIQSIRKQTYKNLEIILVDDGSTDQCSLLCDNYAKEDDRIKVIHKKNGGLSDARNAGLQIAAGEYVGFVDSDDYIHPRMYELLYEACINNEVEVAMCRFQIFEENAVELQYDECKAKCFTREEILSAYINENTNELITPSVWSKLFKRECIKELSFPVGKLCEDIVYTTKAFYNSDKVAYLDAELYYYRQRAGSIMNDNSVLVRRIQEELEQYNNRLTFIQKVGNQELIQGCKYALYNRIFLRYCDIPLQDTGEVVRLKKQLEQQMQGLREEAKRYYIKVNKQYTILQRLKEIGKLRSPILYRYLYLKTK